MFLLGIFAFIAGIATVLSPCIIPVLPILLAGGTAKGSSRPLGIILGLVLCFTFFTLALTTLVEAFGLSAVALRAVAIGVIALFGLVMIFPALGDLFAKKTAAVAGLGSSLQGLAAASGFWSGFGLGLAMGLVWTPCAGPILAAITTLAATKGVTLEAFWITLSYSIGAAIPMYAIAYGGSKILSSSKFMAKHALAVRQLFGMLMIATAFAIAANLDVEFQQWASKYIPTVTPDDQQAVKEELAKLRGENLFEITQPKDAFGVLRVYGKAPDFRGDGEWINTPPLSLDNLRGKVVLVDFWTYSCINCLRTLPDLGNLYDRYKDKGLVVIGVHTPEFEFEKDFSNVKKAVERLAIRYPVTLDNHYEIWKAYHNAYWPAHYLIDQQGNIRYVHFGEGAEVEMENAIRQLLMETPLTVPEVIVEHRAISPETYLGYGRADHYVMPITADVEKEYSFTFPLPKEGVGLQGKWKVGKEFIESEGDESSISLEFLATRVYLVLAGRSDRPLSVELDQKPLSKVYFTSDMNVDGQLFVKEARKYDVINLHKQYQRRTLTLHIPKGIQAYAFTFGDED